MNDIEKLKQQAAEAALSYVEEDTVIGIGTGSTTNYFIEHLAKMKGRIAGTVASSIASQQKLEQAGIPVLDLNTVDKVSLYVDGADECNERLQLIKGGGGALTREKILATAAERFVCIIDERKMVDQLGDFGIPIEVIPMARSMVAREIVKLGGDPNYRTGYKTDNGNVVLDTYHIEIMQPMTLEDKINTLVGVVENGLFANRAADIVLMAQNGQGVKTLTQKS